MGGLSLWHWLIVLVIVVLVFGTKRLNNVGKDLGEAVKGFKKGMQRRRPRRRQQPQQSLPPATPPERVAPTPTATHAATTTRSAGRALITIARRSRRCSISASPNCS